MSNFENVMKSFVTENTGKLNLADLNSDNTAIIIVDVINGFLNEGPLASERVQRIVEPISELMKYAKAHNIEMVAFADTHEEDSAEFRAYPPHCVKGSSECEVVKELKEIGGYTLIEKASTNGFIEPDFIKWLTQDEKHCNITKFVVVGCCTDICIEGFAMTLNQFNNASHRYADIIVPINCVETYDAPNHDAEFMNLVTFYKFICNGIKVVK